MVRVEELAEEVAAFGLDLGELDLTSQVTAHYIQCRLVILTQWYGGVMLLIGYCVG